MIDLAPVAKMIPALIANGKIGEAAGAAVEIAPTLMGGPFTIQTVLSLHKSGGIPSFLAAVTTLGTIGDQLLADPTQAANVVALLSSVIPAAAPATAQS